MKVDKSCDMMALQSGVSPYNAMISSPYVPPFSDLAKVGQVALLIEMMALLSHFGSSVLGYQVEY